MKNYFTISRITQIAILSALAIVLYQFPKFPLPFFPVMLKVQFSMLPTLIGGFVLGPIGGTIICVIKFLFKLLTTQTAAVGEIVDLCIGLCVVLVTSLIYKVKHDKKGAIIALIFGTITWVFVAVLINAVYALPAYELIGIDKVLNMLKIIPGVTEENYRIKYLFYGCLPFNLMLSIFVSIITYFVYKKISLLFNMMDKKIEKK